MMSDDTLNSLSFLSSNDSDTVSILGETLYLTDVAIAIRMGFVDVINVRDASEEVFAIPEIMSNIYQFLDRKKDLLSCMLLCKKGFPVAAKEMFREMRRTDFTKIYETDCSFVSSKCFLCETQHSKIY